MVTLLPSLALMKKGPSVIVLLIGAVLALSFLDTCHAAENTTNKEAKSMEKGMDFLFVMTKGFLELIQPNRIYEKYDLYKLANSQPYREENFRDWKKLTLYLIGFAVCICIGIVFMVVMPIVGCCLCCCRTCCHKCGGKQQKHDPKNARYKRGCYATFLTIFNTFILFAVVCTFVTNELYKKRFIEDPEMFRLAKRGTKDIVDYIDTSLTELKNVAENQVSLLETQILTQLKDAGNRSVTKLSKTINVTLVLDQVEALGNGIIKLNTSVSNLRDSLESLNKTGSDLEMNLNKVKDKVMAKLKSCTQNDCNNIRTYIKDTNVNAQFSLQDSQADLLNKLQQYLNISNLAQQAQNRFNSVSKNISDVVEQQNTTIAETFNKVSKQMNSSLNFDDIKKAIPSKEIDAQLDKAMELYKSEELASSILWYIGLCVGSILLLIVVCNYLGILFGLCGERAGENTPCCNRGVAANFLLAGVGFYFLFCWILIFIVLVEFIVGGLFYTELCRYLKKDDPQQLKPILDNFNYTYTVFNEVHNLYTYDVVDKCHKNNSILNSLGFSKSVLTKQIPKQELKDAINKIKTGGIIIGDVTLMDQTLKTKLENFKTLDTKLNLTKYEEQLNELNKKIITTDLNVIAHNLTQLSSVVNISFDDEANALRKITNTTYKDMRNEMDNLANILKDVKNNMNLGSTIDALITTVQEVEKKVKSEGNNIVNKIVKEETLNLINIVDDNLKQLISTIINKIAPCRPLYDLLFSYTDMLCITLLNPINGFWFSTGWAIFFFLPTIIFATKLAGLYRCWYKNDPTQENADCFAAGDADNIPLARVNQGKSSPQGLPNGAYDEIPSNKYHPTPNVHPYNYAGPGHHYSGYPVYPPPSYHDTRMNPGRY